MDRKQHRCFKVLCRASLLHGHPECWSFVKKTSDISKGGYGSILRPVDGKKGHDCKPYDFGVLEFLEAYISRDNPSVALAWDVPSAQVAWFHMNCWVYGAFIPTNGFSSIGSINQIKLWGTTGYHLVPCLKSIWPDWCVISSVCLWVKEPPSILANRPSERDRSTEENVHHNQKKRNSISLDFGCFATQEHTGRHFAPRNFDTPKWDLDISTALAACGFGYFNHLNRFLATVAKYVFKIIIYI